MRDRVRQRSGNEHTQDFITDTELNALINLKYKELYGKLTSWGIHKSETTYTIATDGSANYALPADLWAVLVVFRADSGAYARLDRHDVRFKPSTANQGPAATYRVVGSAIEFSPVPSSGDYLLVYVPVPGDLELDSDTLDGVLGWEEYVVVACTISLLEKEQLDTTDHRRDLLALEARIIDEAKAAEMTEGHVVQDVRGCGGYILPGGNRGVTGFWGYPGFRYWV